MLSFIHLFENDGEFIPPPDVEQFHPKYGYNLGWQNDWLEANPGKTEEDFRQYALNARNSEGLQEPMLSPTDFLGFGGSFLRGAVKGLGKLGSEVATKGFARQELTGLATPSKIKTALSGGIDDLSVTVPTDVGINYAITHN